MSFVLIVDDHRNTGRLLTRFLRARGFDAVPVESGPAALALLQTASPKPALILLDVVMAGMDGLQTLELIRQVPGATDIPVIMLSALDGQDNIERAKQLGALEYWTKGNSRPHHLIEMVRQRMSRDTEGDRHHSDARVSDTE
jgi:putative two-component system response regulator